MDSEARSNIKGALKDLVFASLQNARDRGGEWLLVGDKVVLGILQRGSLLQLACSLSDPECERGNQSSVTREKVEKKKKKKK